MKNTKVENMKIVKAGQRRRVAGVQVRSGVKAGGGGWGDDFGSGHQGGKHGDFGRRPG
jgi:hypothetical protein